MTELQRKSSSAKDKFIKLAANSKMVPNSKSGAIGFNGELCGHLFEQETLLLNDNDKSRVSIKLIKGIVPIDKNTDSLYFVTEDLYLYYRIQIDFRLYKYAIVVEAVWHAQKALNTAQRVEINMLRGAAQ